MAVAALPCVAFVVDTLVAEFCARDVDGGDYVVFVFCRIWNLEF